MFASKLESASHGNHLGRGPWVGLALPPWEACDIGFAGYSPWLLVHCVPFSSGRSVTPSGSETFRLRSHGSMKAQQDGWSQTLILWTLYSLQISLYPGNNNCIDPDNCHSTPFLIKSLIVLNKTVTVSVLLRPLHPGPGLIRLIPWPAWPVSGNLGLVSKHRHVHTSTAPSIRVAERASFSSIAYAFRHSLRSNFPHSAETSTE